MDQKSKGKNRALATFVVITAIVLFSTVCACIVFAIVVARLKTSLEDLHDVVLVHHQQLITLNEQTGSQESPGGVTFTRYGRTTCPHTNGTETLYIGKVVGSGIEEGGSSEYTCLPNANPEFLHNTTGLQPHRTQLYGTEYEFFNTSSSPGSHNAPCAVCYTRTRIAKVTIPAKITCPPSWTREYYGYYMSTAQNFTQNTKTPVCMDNDAQALQVGEESDRQSVRSFLHFMETTCIGISCPPYSNGAEVTCAVCTK